LILLFDEVFKPEVEPHQIMAPGVAFVPQGLITVHQNTRNPFDLSWKNLISGRSHKLIYFVLNATIDSVVTPDMLRLWKNRAFDEVVSGPVLRNLPRPPNLLCNR
jgi:hypothetical protein